MLWHFILPQCFLNSAPVPGSWNIILALGSLVQLLVHLLSCCSVILLHYLGIHNFKGIYKQNIGRNLTIPLQLFNRCRVILINLFGVIPNFIVCVLYTSSVQRCFYLSVHLSSLSQIGVFAEVTRNIVLPNRSKIICSHLQQLQIGCLENPCCSLARKVSELGDVTLWFLTTFMHTDEVM